MSKSKDKKTKVSFNISESKKVALDHILEVSRGTLTDVFEESASWFIKLHKVSGLETDEYRFLRDYSHELTEKMKGKGLTARSQEGEVIRMALSILCAIHKEGLLESFYEQNDENIANFVVEQMAKGVKNK